MKKNRKIYMWFGITVLVSSIIMSCSTEKNTFLSRSYHGITAKYNGYFNATELIRLSLLDFRSNAEEDYYEILPIELVPDENQVIGMYPSIDTAISKCTKVITNHSMPSNDRPSRKKEEHNPWIDENWTEVGIAQYYRRDYEGALKSFEYVRKFYHNDPSLYVGQLWMAKVYIATGDLTKAKLSLDNLDKVIKEEEERKKEKKPKKRRKKSKIKKKKNDEEIAKFPKKIRFDFECVKADLALKNNETDKAIEYLEESLNYAKKSEDKARINFILGQLYEGTGKNQEAAAHYKVVLKKNANYPMQFNARMKRALLRMDDDSRKKLLKMLKDAKNAPYKDQIYYALADIEFREGNEKKGIEYLHLCAFYSTKNTRQKGMAYERLADMSFSKKNYVSAQKYYDSCAQVINDDYPNGQAIKEKAENLSALVVAVETVQYEDSVQRIAMMSEGDREEYLKNLIKQIEKEEAERKEREAIKLRELQQNENLFAESESGNKWYWNNAKAKQEGFEEFKRQWGTREDVDDWRRSERVISANEEENPDFAGTDSLKQDTDTLNVEYLLSKIPTSDSAFQASNKRLLEAHYNAGIIYKEQLAEPNLAHEHFEAVVKKETRDPHDVMSAFQLYKMAEGKNSAEAQKYRDYILKNYPDSDYASYLIDPNYFVKKQERDALAEKAYVKVLDRYSQGMYYAVMTKATMVVNNEKDNIYRSKYMLLLALSKGQLNENKKELLPLLNQIIEEYPSTLEAEKAKEMMDVINNGYSENIEAEFGSKFPFNYDDKEELYIIVFVPDGQSSASAKSRVVNFHREYFSRDGLKISSKIYGSEQSVLLVNSFDTESKASEYIRVYKKTRKHLLDLQNADIFMITKSNLKILFEKQNIKDYQLFYDEYY